MAHSFHQTRCMSRFFFSSLHCHNIDDEIVYLNRKRDISVVRIEACAIHIEHSILILNKRNSILFVAIFISPYSSYETKKKEIGNSMQFLYSFCNLAECSHRHFYNVFHLFLVQFVSFKNSIFIVCVRHQQLFTYSL